MGIQCTRESGQPEKYPAADFIRNGEYLGEYYPTDGWRECSPDAVGMDPEILEQMNEEIAGLVEKEGFEIHSVLVARKGYIVAEQYYSRYFDSDTEHRIYSITKSFTSALVGIAISEGYIKDVDVTMLDYFQDYEIANLSQDKQDITLEQMLTMSAGLDWDELDYPYSDPQNTHYQWERSDNMIQFVLDRPMEYAPGDVQDYNSGLSELLSVIVQKATGMRADSFALENLFVPMGIDDYYWQTGPQGNARGSTGLRLSPRNQAKLGLLHACKGKWEGEQLLPEDWVTESGKKHIVSQHIPDFWYGYQFWVHEDGLMYTGLGYAGQWLMIVPSLDLVVVFNNHFDEGDQDQEGTPVRLFFEYIMPSVID